MAFSGSLQDVPLPDVLQLVASQGKGGLLTLTRDGEAVRIAILEGSAVEADSSRRPIERRLGTMLVRAGRISRKDLERALALKKGSDRKLGQVLVAAGLASSEDVRKALSLQLQETVFAVLRWVDGSYEFERCEVDYDRENVEPVTVQAMLMDGMRMIDEWPLLEKRLAHRGMVLHRLSARDKEIAAAPAVEDEAFGETPAVAKVETREEPVLEGYEAEVYRQIDGVATVQQIIERTFHLEFEVCRALVDLWDKELVGPAYEGRLEETDLVELVLALGQARGTGALELERSPTTRTTVTISFRDGRLIGAQSDDPDRGLAGHLFRKGLLTRSELESSGPGTVAERLVAKGRLRQEELSLLARDQMEALIRWVFGWSEGSYRYRPGLAGEIGAGGPRVRTVPLLTEVVRSEVVWSRMARIADAFPEAVYRLADVGAQKLSVLEEALTPGERISLRHFEGGARLADACAAASRGGEFQVYQTLLTGRLLGLIEGGEISRGAATLLGALRGDRPAETEGASDELDSLFEPPKPIRPPVQVAAPATPAPPPAPAPAPAKADSSGTFDIAQIAAEMSGRASAFWEDIDIAPSIASGESSAAMSDFDAADLAPD